MKVGLAGFGNVGKELTRRLNAGALPEVELVAVCARDLDKAKAEAQAFSAATAGRRTQGLAGAL